MWCAVRHTDGCYDGKVTSYTMAMKLQADAVSGPASDQQPPFRWSGFPSMTIVGQPAVFNFSWVPMDPQW